MPNHCIFETETNNQVITCPRALYGNNLCILHDTNPNKNHSEFDKVLDSELNNVNVEFYDFRGIKCFHKPNPFVSKEIRNINKSIRFDGAIFFNSEIHFKNLNFNSECSFSGAEFKHGGTFESCKFLEQLNLDLIKFPATGTLTLKYLKCLKSASLEGAQFGVQFKLYDSEFQGDVTFRNATFGSEFILQYVKIFGYTSFENATFHKGISLLKVHFDKEVAFHVNGFHGIQKFYLVKFHGKTTFGRESIFGNDFSFGMCDLKGLRLLDLPFLEGRVKIENCTWPRKKHWILPRRDFIADENDTDEILGLPKIYYLLKKEFSRFFGVRFGSVEQVRMDSHTILKAYEKLHKNYYENSEYDQAKEFYVSSMVQKRKLEKFFSVSRFTNFIYYVLSRYGESMLRPFLAMLAIWFLFPVFLLQEGYVLVNPHALSESDSVLIEKPFLEKLPDGSSELIFVTDEYWDTFKLSFSLSTFLRSGAPRPPVTSNANMILILETLLTGLFFGFLIMGIRRRFAPKKPIR